MIEQSSPHYWDKTAEDFDAIYSGQNKSKLGRFLDRWLRQDIFQRVDETVKIVNSLGPHQRVLDVGTGTGRLCIPLAKAGHRVVGVDFSREMLEMADELTKAAGVGDSCEFVDADLLNNAPDELQRHETFDAVVALGVFDYISDPTPLVQRMASFKPQKIIIAFPKQGTLRCYLRRMRYKVQGLSCPLFFYTPEQIHDFANMISAAKIDIQPMGKFTTLFTTFSVAGGAPASSLCQIGIVGRTILSRDHLSAWSTFSLLFFSRPLK